MSVFEKSLQDGYGISFLTVLRQPERTRIRARTAWGFIELWLTDPNMEKFLAILSEYEQADDVERIGWRRTVPHQIHDTFIHVELCGDGDRLWFEAYQAGCVPPTEVSYYYSESLPYAARKWWAVAR